jgi:hypothetical protein
MSREWNDYFPRSARREARGDGPKGFPGKRFRQWTERDDFREIIARIFGPLTTRLGAAIEESSQLRGPQALENSRWGLDRNLANCHPFCQQ